jgi:OmpA-like transmembrane domain
LNQHSSPLKVYFMITLEKLFVAAVLMVSASLASADIFDSLYVAADVGKSQFIKSCSGIPDCKDSDFSHRTSVGLLVADFTNAELGYYSSGKAHKNDGTNNSNSIDSVEWQLSGLRYYPIGNGRFSAFGRLGLVHWEAAEVSVSKRIEASGNSILLGVGGKYFITKTTSARVQLGNASTSWKKNVFFLGAGLVYQFH